MPSRSRDMDDVIERHPLRQLAGLLLGLAAAYLFLCLVTYSASDPSFNRVTNLPVANAGGTMGAYIADLALQVLGVASGLAVLVLFTWGWKLFFGQYITYLWLRITMLLAGMVMLSILITPITPIAGWPLSAGYGGSIGTVLMQAAPGLFRNVFFFIFLTALAGFAVLQAFGMSISEWREVGSRIYGAVTGAVEWVREWWNARRDEYAEEYEDEEEDDEEYEEESLWERIKARIFFWRREEEWDEDEEEVEEDDEEVDEDEDYEEEDEEEEEEPVRKSRKKAVKEAPKRKPVLQQASLDLPRGDFTLPPLTLFSPPARSKKSGMNEAALQQNARLLETVLQDFGVQGSITEISPGPVVTLYELEPAAGTRSSRVIGLSDDIARSMSAVSARIAVVPGRSAIGIELPNAHREMVNFRELCESDAYQDSEAKLPLALGKDIGGTPVIVDLARMPHLLVAGTTGSGKSVAINTMIMSLVARCTPDECKFIMVDPKMLELSIYDGIPHLLTPVVTEPGKAVVALKWTVKEMENRYRMMANLSVRNIDSYNKQIREAKSRGKQLSRRVQTGFDAETGDPIIEEVPLEMVELPYIVVIVDEMADLMLVAGKDIESSIQRLAQMARAAGIHLIMATQRPSVDVITGVIKANFPTRISFQVTSRIDSRTILGDQGAEQLLGQGDMLYMAGGGRVTRVHGPFVSDKEVENIVSHLKAQGAPTYIEDVTREDEEGDTAFGGSGDELYDKAVNIVLRDGKASTSYLQRQLKIGYNRAADLIDRMEREGVVSPANHAGKREVLGNSRERSRA